MKVEKEHLEGIEGSKRTQDKRTDYRGWYMVFSWFANRFRISSREMWNGLFFLENRDFIHRMQIWRTTRSASETSYMKARLVSLWCFVFPMLPQETLASSSDLFCYISLCLRVAALMLLHTNFFHVARLRQSAWKYWNTFFLVIN